MNFENIYKWNCGCIWYFDDIDEETRVWKSIHMCTNHDDGCKEIRHQKHEIDLKRSAIKNITKLELSILKLNNFQDLKRG